MVFSLTRLRSARLAYLSSLKTCSWIILSASNTKTTAIRPLKISSRLLSSSLNLTSLFLLLMFFIAFPYWVLVMIPLVSR